MATVFFHYTEKRIRIRNTKKIKRFIPEIFKGQELILSRVDYIFCSDKYLLQINKKFLLHDYYTDIITFSLNKAGEPIIGEVYISLELVKENAKEYNVLIMDEILRIIFHGALHLSGFRDKKRVEKKKMTEREDFFLRRFQMFS